MFIAPRFVSLVCLSYDRNDLGAVLQYDNGAEVLWATGETDTIDDAGRAAGHDFHVRLVTTDPWRIAEFVQKYLEPEMAHVPVHGIIKTCAPFDFDKPAPRRLDTLDIEAKDLVGMRVACAQFQVSGVPAWNETSARVLATYSNTPFDPDEDYSPEIGMIESVYPRTGHVQVDGVSYPAHLVWAL